MKYAAQRDLSVASLRSALPERCLAELPTELPPGPYTLLVFRSDRRDVVLSRVVQSALDREAITDGQQLVAVAGCFTAEGLELLRERRAIILQTSEWHWTDDSYKCIRERL